MIPQHLYMIVPSEDATGISVDLRMILDNSLMIKFGWKDSRVSVAKIGEVNGKSALHLYFREDKYHKDWTELVQEMQFNSGTKDTFADIDTLESALCLKPGSMICLDVDHLKQRDPDFAVVNQVSGGEGGFVDVPVLMDTVFA